MTTTSPRLHEAAVDAAVAAARGLAAADRPLIELARALARQVDAAGPQGPGTRLAGTYLIAIRTLMTRLGSLVDADPTSRLAQMRQRAQHPKQPARTTRKAAAS